MEAAADRQVERVASLADEAATVALARRIAAVARPGDVIALAGELGVGKTRFARAFVDALTGEREEVPSPTFTLVQTYEFAGRHDLALRPLPPRPAPTKPTSSASRRPWPTASA